jgi:predicted transcriptional regulator
MRRPALSLSLCLLLAAPAALGDPPSGSVVNAVGLPRAPEFTLESTAGRTRHLRDYLGRVVIIIYEDRDSNQQNNPLKESLAARARSEDLTRDVSLVAVANLSPYDFWPARGYARDAVVEIARQMGYEIMIDWSGAMSTAYRFRPGSSHVMVLSRDGRVLFRHAGSMSARTREAFFELLTQAARAPR